MKLPGSKLASTSAVYLCMLGTQAYGGTSKNQAVSVESNKSPIINKIKHNPIVRKVRMIVNTGKSRMNSSNKHLSTADLYKSEMVVESLKKNHGFSMKKSRQTVHERVRVGKFNQELGRLDKKTGQRSPRLKENLPMDAGSLQDLPKKSAKVRRKSG